MRRHILRLAAALLVATTLTACADLATAPEAPKATTGDTVLCGEHQGSSTKC